MTNSNLSHRRILDDVDPSHEQLLIFVFCGMTLGAIITHFLSRYKTGLPYTVVVFLVGGIISLIIDSDANLAHFENSLKSWKKIDPELLLYLFLPALLFGEAMSLKWYNVKAVFSQALLLAGPGVLFGAYTMALFLYLCMPLNWSWYMCMLFGSILSATDPVAVVALLKDAGADPKLTILIIGESLMNDGTAMVLFTLYFKMMEGHKYDGGDIILFFLKECVGAPLLGALMGLVGVFWLSKASNPLSPVDITIQIVITVVCAYLVFFVAQYECEISGVLACCSAGIMFAWLAPPLILEHETMHSVWGFIEWMGNTLIFLLAGLIIGGSKEETHISRIDYLYVVVLYTALMGIRCLNITIFYPLLSRLGLKCSVEDAKFMSWAGLRGALAVALSLVVYGEYEELGISERDADKLFFYCGGVATLTLVINATTAQAVLKSLGLLKDENNVFDLSQLNSVRTRLHQELMHDLVGIDLGHGYCIDGPDECKEHIASVITPEVISRNVSLLAHYESAMTETSDRMAVQVALMSRHKRVEDMLQCGDRYYHPEIISFFRTTFLEILRSQYWRFVEESKLPRQALVTQTLLYSVDSALRRVWNVSGRDWTFLQKEMQPDRLVDFLNFFPLLQRIPLLMRLRDKLETRRMYFKIYLLSSFIEAHERTQKQFSAMASATVSPSSSSSDKGSCHEFPEQTKVLEESAQSVSEAREHLGSLNREVVSSVLVEQASRMLLAKEIKHIQELLEEGLLNQRVAEKFLEVVSDDLRALDSEQKKTFE